jgi:hypothetical protein
MNQSPRKRTTLTVSRETHAKFNQAKPYDSITADEFLTELLDNWGDSQ